MIPPVVEAIERVVHSVAAWRFGALVRRRAELCEAIRALSESYNDDGASSSSGPNTGARHARRRRKRRQAPDVDLLARLLFFTIADLPKVGHPITELHRCAHLPAATTWHVLDVGAGCGAQSIGLLAQLSLLDLTPAPEIVIDAVDINVGALALMEEVFESLSQQTELEQLAPRLRLQSSSLTETPAGPYELILVGGLLAELPAGEHLELVGTLLRSLAADGSLIIIEPALRRTARALHQLRDAVIDQKMASVFAPCTHERPCPALAAPGDWCHELRIWTPPPLLRQLANATGLRRRDLKWAYLTLRTIPDNVVGQDEGWSRVVSSQLRSKGKREVFLCDESGRKRVTRLDRDASEANEGFDQLARGCLANLSLLEHRGQSLRVGRESILRWIDSFANE